MTFCAPKSVSLVRALRGDEVADKAVLAAHTAAIAEALEYLAVHAGYTRVHNSATGDKDLVRLPGLVAIAYQHETSRAGDPHLHTHVLVPNRQARGDGKLVSIDGTSLFHEGARGGVIYQATLRRELHRALGLEWAPVDPATGMAEIAGIDPTSISAWSQRSVRCASGPRTIWSSSTARRCRRRSWRPPKSHPPGQTRTTGLGGAGRAVACRCAGFAAGPRSLPRGAQVTTRTARGCHSTLEQTAAAGGRRGDG